ncbi:hypothetical protein EYF80_006145 [Liparis tanakae]|uniref:Uncharacterized protein n=1 Tax=Liparis tanakae TaxID=230148 RepID=A0A4Z2J0S0_9TELE|nr:hypothetical protein EYF80_006145 [Liparis tanakae]
MWSQATSHQSTQIGRALRLMLTWDPRIEHRLIFEVQRLHCELTPLVPVAMPGGVFRTRRSYAVRFGHMAVHVEVPCDFGQGELYAVELRLENDLASQPGVLLKHGCHVQHVILPENAKICVTHLKRSPFKPDLRRLSSELDGCQMVHWSSNAQCRCELRDSEAQANMRAKFWRSKRTCWPNSLISSKKRKRKTVGAMRSLSWEICDLKAKLD